MITLKDIQSEFNKLSTPKGFTASQAAAEWGVGKAAANDKIRKASSLSLIRFVGCYNIPRIDGRMASVPHYEVVKKSKR